MQFLSYAAKEIARLLAQWVKAKVVDYIFAHVEDWVEDGLNWVLRKITGDDRTTLERKGKDLGIAQLEVGTLFGDKRSWNDVVSSLLASQEGSAWLSKWQAKLEEATGFKAQEMRKYIDLMPIPREESIYVWAGKLASRFGLTVSEVIARRENAA